MNGGSMEKFSYYCSTGNYLVLTLLLEAKL